MKRDINGYPATGTGSVHRTVEAGYPMSILSMEIQFTGTGSVHRTVEAGYPMSILSMEI